MGSPEGFRGGIHRIVKDHVVPIPSETIVLPHRDQEETMLIIGKHFDAINNGADLEWWMRNQFNRLVFLDPDQILQYTFEFLDTLWRRTANIFEMSALEGLEMATYTGLPKTRTEVLVELRALFGENLGAGSAHFDENTKMFSTIQPRNKENRFTRQFIGRQAL